MSGQAIQDAVVVFSTCASYADAQRIGATLVAERLAACVNIIPGLTSIYRWQGAVEQSSEHLMVIKTTTNRYAALEVRLRELHSYEVPEIISLPTSGGSDTYLKWLVDQVERDV
jgi:periplasmic divalent cation tolerance protein